MSELISRQAALDALNHELRCGAVINQCGLEMAYEVIEGLPSAEPQIIHCRDCKHYKFADNRAFGFPVKRCEWTGFEDVDDDDFCSRAERRTE